MQPAMHTADFTAEFLTSLDRISAAQWNGITGTDYPFLRHEFLYGLEKTACTTADTGWQPCHLLLRRRRCSWRLSCRCT